MPNGAPGKILSAISDTFDTDIVSEHDPRYWGFDTHEEWDAVLEEEAKRHRDECYVEIMRSVRKEPNKIGSGTLDEIKAKIAIELVEERCELREEKHKDELM